MEMHFSIEHVSIAPESSGGLFNITRVNIRIVYSYLATEIQSMKFQTHGLNLGFSNDCCGQEQIHLVASQCFHFTFAQYQHVI